MKDLEALIVAVHWENLETLVQKIKSAIPRVIANLCSGNSTKTTIKQLSAGYLLLETHTILGKSITPDFVGIEL